MVDGPQWVDPPVLILTCVTVSIDPGCRIDSARVEPRRSSPIIRSYHGESTGSHPNSEVKHHWACSVLRWGTTWESQVSNVFAVLESNPEKSIPHSAGRASDIISESHPGVQSYLLGLLAKIKCSICSYQLNLWYVDNCRL